MDPSPAPLQRLIPVADILIDARTYQFKGGGDGFGVTDRLAAVTAWDPVAAAVSPVLLHRWGGPQLDSPALYAVDGHQRVGLAKRLGIEALWAVILSADTTVAEARRIGALLNLQHGTGTAIDVARLLRAAPLTADERATLPADAITGRALRLGEALASLSADAFTFVINSGVHPDPARNAAYAAVVGRRVTDPAEQLAALQLLGRHPPESTFHAESIISALLAAGFERDVQVGLFGEVALATSLAEPIADILAATRRTLLAESSALGSAVRHEGRLAAHGNILNRAGNEAGAAEASVLDQMLATYGHTVGPVRTVVKDSAAALQRGTLTRAAAVDAVLAALAAERPVPVASTRWAYAWPGVSGTVDARTEAKARAAIRARLGIPFLPNKASVTRVAA